MSQIDVARLAPPRSTRPWDQPLAIAEVIAAFVVTHVTYRAIKQFTVVGDWERAAHTNLTPGAVMIGFTLITLLVCRRNFESYGLSVKRWRYNLTLGLVGALAVLSIQAVALRVTRLQFDATRPPDPHAPLSLLRIMAIAAVALPAYFAVLALMRQRRPILDRIPPAISLLAIGALASMLPLTAAFFHASETWLTSLWLFFGAGVGEELFYRGYIQSRVDFAFGRPWRALGFQFGFGLIVSSLLFGLVHALNTVDYFHGRLDFGWSMGLQSAVVGVFYGLIRSKTDSVIPGSIMHGLSDIFAFTASVLSRPA
jgi:membrane protease YdiL (CAAX protease family)